MTSMLFTLKDRVGSLKGVLDVFERHNVSMAHLESKPHAMECVPACAGAHRCAVAAHRCATAVRARLPLAAGLG